MLRFIVIALLYFWAVANVDDSLTTIGLYVAVPLAFGLSFGCAKSSIFKDKYFKIFIYFVLWIAFTWILAENDDYATKFLIQMAGVVLLCVAVMNLSTDQRNIIWVYGLYVILFIAALNYAIEHMAYMQLDVTTGRFSDEHLDPNVLADYTFYATISLFMMGSIKSNVILKEAFRIMFLVMIPLSFYIAIFTASRQVMIVQLPLLSTLLFFRYIEGSSFKVKLLFIGCLIGAVLIASNQVMETYDNSFLKKRSEKRVEDDSRYGVLKEAMTVGLDHPIMGVGPACFALHSTNHIFSHNSYAEAFANHGVVGLLLYLWLLGYFIKCQFKNYLATKDKTYLVYLSFGIIYAFYNFFYVFYSDLWLMSFFLFFAKDSEIYAEESDNSLLLTDKTSYYEKV